MSSHFIRHNLFKPFASTKQGGFGVGAYEARALILAMQGRIDVFSREGEGTKFRITLPLAREPAAQPGEERARAA
jgi:signal transduction histidine kinase